MKDEDESTKITELSYQENLKLNEYKELISQKIKFITSRKGEDILREQNEFYNHLDYLSVNSTNKPCSKEFKEFLWKNCPHMIRGGIQIQNLIDFVALKSVQKNSEFQEEIIKTFIEIKIKPDKATGIGKELKILGGGIAATISFLLGYKVGEIKNEKMIEQQAKKTAKELKEVCVQSDETSLRIPTSGISPFSTVRCYSNVDNYKNPVESSIPMHNVISESAKKSYKMVNSHDFSSVEKSSAPHVTSRLFVNSILSVYKMVVEIIGKRLLKVRNFCMGLFFEKSHMGKTWRFSPIHSICSIYEIAQILGLFYCVFLIFRKENKGLKENQKDRFFD